MNLVRWIRVLLVVTASPLFLTATARGQAPAAVAGSTPSPEAIEKAREHFQRAEKLYNDRAFEAALVELLKAYELAPSYRILYNIGLAHLEIGDYAAATQAFRQYLAEGGSELGDARRKEVTNKIDSLTDRVATLRIQVNEPNAEVFVDDIPIGRSPLAEPVLVNAGRRRIAATLPPKPQRRTVVVVAGGDSTTVTLTFPSSEPTPTSAARASSASPSPAPVATPPPPPSSDRTLVWVGWAGTGLLAAGTITTGILAMSASGDLRDERESFVADPTAKRESLDSAADRAQTLGVVTDVLGAATLLVGGLTLYATFATDRAEAEPGVEVGAAPNGLRMSGRF